MLAALLLWGDTDLYREQVAWPFALGSCVRREGAGASGDALCDVDALLRCAARLFARSAAR